MSVHNGGVIALQRPAGSGAVVSVGAQDETHAQQYRSVSTADINEASSSTHVSVDFVRQLLADHDRRWSERLSNQARRAEEQQRVAVGALHHEIERLQALLKVADIRCYEHYLREMGRAATDDQVDSLQQELQQKDAHILMLSRQLNARRSQSVDRACNTDESMSVTMRSNRPLPPPTRRVTLAESFSTPRSRHLPPTRTYSAVEGSDYHIQPHSDAPANIEKGHSGDRWSLMRQAPTLRSRLRQMSRSLTASFDERQDGTAE